MLIYYHMFAVFSWALFLTGFIKSYSEFSLSSKILMFASFVSMLAVLALGTKLMLMMPGVAKSGKWLHIKLTIDVVVMLFNVFLVFTYYKKKHFSKIFLNILYWLVVLMFLTMLFLTLFKPF